MDTNHVVAWEADNPALMAKLDPMSKDNLVCTCAIVIGEMSAGHYMTDGDLQRRHQVRQFLNIWVIPYVVDVRATTESYYGRIMGRLWKIPPLPKPSSGTDAHLVSFGVNVNDVWIVACAWEHNLVLLTSDNMTNIRNVTPEVAFENWLV
jgi:predicted nucleic acid-binding protein